MRAPLVPADADVRNFPYTPIFRARLFGSSFHARANDAEWRAGVTLWLKAWDQVPAGTLPMDDTDLCRLAELGRDLKAWRKVKAGALHGWIECTDGRLHHPVVAEGVNEALRARMAQIERTAKARLAALQKKLEKATTEGQRQRLTEEIVSLSQTVQQSLLQNKKPSVTDRATESVTKSNRTEQNRTEQDQEQDQEPLVQGKVSLRSIDGGVRS